MKNISFLFKLITVFSIFTLNAAIAAPVTLFAQPDPNSRAVAKVDLSKGIVPIFTSKDGKWVKVGDPANGNVGWLQSKTLSDSPTGSFIYKQEFIKSDDGEQTVQSVQFSNKLKSQGSITNKSMLDEQREIRKSFEKSMREYMQEINQFYQRRMELFYHDYPSAPFMPIVVMPVEKTPKAKPVASPKPANTANETTKELKVDKKFNH